ncbi:hypothetical protein ACQ4LE_004131 [Meloidogyne hapla]
MLYLYASDYTLNSMLYQAFQLDRLTIRIEEQSLPPLYRSFVRTTCPDIDQTGDFIKSLCVGKLVPALGKHFPNTTTKFVMVPHQLPEMLFKQGLGTMELKAHSTRLVDISFIEYISLHINISFIEYNMTNYRPRSIYK